jgi:RNA recognition motif-containing protein
MQIHSCIRAFLLLVTCSITKAWIPTTPSKIHRSKRTHLAAERRFAQAQTKKKYGADSKIASIHKERLHTAGRAGTKRFVDPCKVFIGNLPFSADEKTLQHFVLKTMGQSKIVLHSAKVISDWKTGKSKGYGFVQFIDPIYATVCMEVVNGKLLDGRPVSVSQGKKKEQENELYLKKKKKKPETDEEAVISQALDEAESEEEIPVFGGSEEDFELDAALFGIVGDDEDDDAYDGVFLERPSKFEDDIDSDLNREQRRDAARRMKRKKMPHKGFG